MIDAPLSDIAAELAREGKARAKLYPDLVAKGRMTEDQAVAGRAVLAAMATDLDRMKSPTRPREETHKFSWAERRQALQRELAYRARFYPKWISEGTLDQAEADRRTRPLAELLAIYDDGFDWRASNGLLPLNQDGEDYRTARLEWLRHYFGVSLGRGDAAMAEGLIRMIRLEHAPDLVDELEAQLHPAQQEELAL
jgi:hypothetical protein